MVKIDILQWCAHELMLGAETLVSRSWLTRNTTLEILREPRSQMSITRNHSAPSLCPCAAASMTLERLGAEREMFHISVLILVGSP